MKLPLMALAILIAVAVPVASQKPAESPRSPQFENAEVKVWRTTILPDAPLSLHRHEHPRVLVALEGGSVKVVQQSGASETHQWDSGKAYWLPADPPNQLHVDVVDGKKPIEVMVVELKNAK